MRFAHNRAAHKIEQRYPRLLRLMKWVAILSTGEATACLRDYVDGFEYSSEAVNSYGGATAVIQRAVSLRTNYPLRAMIARAGE